MPKVWHEGRVKLTLLAVTQPYIWMVHQISHRLSVGMIACTSDIPTALSGLYELLTKTFSSVSDQLIEIGLR